MNWQELIAIAIAMVCGLVVVRSFWRTIAGGGKKGDCGSWSGKNSSPIQIGMTPDVHPPKTER